MMTAEQFFTVTPRLLDPDEYSDKFGRSVSIASDGVYVDGKRNRGQAWMELTPDQAYELRRKLNEALDQMTQLGFDAGLGAL